MSSFYRPTDCSRQRCDDLEREWAPIPPELQRILETEVPVFDEAALQAGVTAVMPPKK